MALTTLEQPCDDLVVHAHAALTTKSTDTATSRSCSTLYSSIFGDGRTAAGVESCKSGRFATSSGSRSSISISAMMYAGPLMNTESQNKFRSMSLAQWWVLLALLSATVSPAPSFAQGTPEQRLACTPDVLRLCSAFIPNADEITICLRERNAELSDACRTGFETGMNQLPGVSDSTGARKRTTR